MLRKRIIFTLIYCDGFFMQSRNFRLQKVGDISWLKKNYKFQNSSFSIDELIILDASRNKKTTTSFLDDVENLAMGSFIPISVGGGIDSFEKCKILFERGADKIVLNSLLVKNSELVKKITTYYGSQSIVASIDVRKIDKSYSVFSDNGTLIVDMNIYEYLSHIQKLGIGEVYINSIDRDGTGFGFDTSLINFIENKIKTPIILAGGAGNYKHFMDCLSLDFINAAATANLFNFMGEGLSIVRDKLIKNGINIAKWNNI
tara:strand:- start:5391 stop:6167 length:777 start_codon:yes stop_codon:yes gene_type:complete